MKALPRSFSTWLDLSTDEEVLALLDLVRAALERRGYVVAVATRRIPRAKEG
jgi:hypothetical protein